MLVELEQDIKKTLKDPTQYGNSKGFSTTHYPTSATNEALKSTDVGKATAFITIDYSGAGLNRPILTFVAIYVEYGQ